MCKATALSPSMLLDVSSTATQTHPHTDIGLLLQEMFALLNKAFCSQIDGQHCVKSDTSEDEESQFIGDSDPSISVCTLNLLSHFIWCRPASGMQKLLKAAHLQPVLKGTNSSSRQVCENLSTA